MAFCGKCLDRNKILREGPMVTVLDRTRYVEIKGNPQLTTRDEDASNPYVILMG